MHKNDDENTNTENRYTAWNIFMKLGTLVHHADGYKNLPQNFWFLPSYFIIEFKVKKAV